MTGNSTAPTKAPGREWDRSGRRFGSTAKARAALGFETAVPLHEGLARTVRWTQEHLNLIDECITRHRDALIAYEQSHQNALT
jgi:nucleoside-diphosphate-sugar epimerase